MSLYGYSAARTLDALTRFGPWRNVAGYTSQQAVIVDAPDGPQLWVDRELEDYRAAWRAAFPDRMPDSLEDIDHVFPRSWAEPLNYRLIRLACISRGANRSAGAGWEKAWSGLYGDPSTAPPREQPDLYPVEYFQWVKLQGVAAGGRGTGYLGAREAGVLKASE
jgi:hypothetical protein